MKRFDLLILSLFLVVGCATTHEGEIAESKEKSLVVSVQKNSALSDKYYIFYEYTLENATAEWKDVQIVDADFEGQETEILTDDKLSAWIEGAELKLKASQYNQDILVGSMIAIGGITAATSNNSNIQKAGLVGMGAAAGVGGAVSVARSQQKATSGMKGVDGTVNVPQTHVFVPSKIAPESYIKRWIVVKMPEPKNLVNPSSLKENFSNRQTLISKVRVDNKDREFSSLVVTSRKKTSSYED